MNNLQYIEKNYIEREALCEKLGISSDKLSTLIEDHIIPSPSYEIMHHYTISSPLGDSFKQKTKKQYFSKTIVASVVNQQSQNQQQFKSHLLRVLKNHPYKSYAYKGIIDGNGEINMAVFNEYAQEKWKYYINGVYGICTHTMNPEEIMRKGIVVARLQEFQRDNGNLELLQELNEEYNKVARDFAPYQRTNSSRGKYLDNTLRNNKLEKLISNYH